jgi:hypothetical protein
MPDIRDPSDSEAIADSTLTRTVDRRSITPTDNK